ncbi:MAG: Gfo/Idh/MocA family oxidoreductase [Ruminococcaceae bacterium]|nr:Gfo/Idh/MocA family oxidoreductase [Oscillospiraceae bacterium]
MKKLVLIGTGARGYSHVASLKVELPDDVSLEGVYDKNPLRAQYVCKECGFKKVYDDFDTCLDEVKPDIVFICTMDCNHHEYAVRAMEKGYDVMLEKPMTTDKEKCLAILEAERRTGKKVTVTFNMRFQPIFASIKELLDKKVVGDILHVDFRWMLDRLHGADYFRRWHRYIENSGGLLVHKATHHFDAINWLIGQSPVEVSAFGSLKFYGANGDRKGERCSTCPGKDECALFRDYTGDPHMRGLYFDAESEDGYFRDRCVFDKDINIYDNMAVNVKYDSGVAMSYSLIAYSPYEGWDLVVTGSEGRLEAKYKAWRYDPDNYTHIKVFAPNGDITEHHIKKLEGDHGGSDKLMRRMLFKGDVPDTLGRVASSIDGAESLLIGACANESIKTGKIVNLAEIIKDYK